MSVGVGLLSVYRTYQVGAAGRLVLGESFEARDDRAAVEHVRARPIEGPMELWQGGRLVGRISKLGQFTPGSN